MIITKRDILGILSDNKKYGLVTVSLTFPYGTTITRAAMEAARGKLVLNIKKPDNLQKKPDKTVSDYLKERASDAGAAGTGKSKRRGNSKYYSKLAKMRMQ